MKKLLPILLSLWAFCTQAQISDSFDKQRLSTFYNIYRFKVKTGLLFDYGLHFTNIEKYDGVRSDSNYLDYDECKLLYASVYSCKFNDKVSMKPPGEVFRRIEAAAAMVEKNKMLLAGQLKLIDSATTREKKTTLLVGLHYIYDRFRHDAIDSGYIGVSKDHIRLREIPGRPSPYVTGETFALVPHRSHLTGAQHRFIFKPELFGTNTGKTIGTLEADFGDGAGWRTVLSDSPTDVSYSTDGEKTVTFRITYTDGSVKESHSRISVKGAAGEYDPAVRYRGRNIAEFPFPLAGFQLPKPYQGKTAGALVTVEYTNPGREIRKPFIVVEGFDPWKILSPDDKKSNFDFIDAIENIGPSGLNVEVIKNGPTLADVLNSANYDLIFIDFDDGTDYIQRNAYLVENVIEWVNSVKQPHNGVIEKNVVIGFSMGGLVARYALRDMELNSKVHDTRLYASIDSPHQGANVPVGFQAMASHLYGSGISSLLAGSPGGGYMITFGMLNADLARSFQMLNSPASRQMLIYNVAGAGGNIHYNNITHEEFMKEYSEMGYPSQGGIRNIVLANGSECGSGQGFLPTDPFIDVNDTYKLGFWSAMLANMLAPGIAAPAHPPLSLGGALTTRSDLRMEFRVMPIGAAGFRFIKQKLPSGKKYFLSSR
ncbi:MAG: esterase/lipase family protein [Bacteroidota bacterium]